MYFLCIALIIIIIPTILFSFKMKKIYTFIVQHVRKLNFKSVAFKPGIILFPIKEFVLY